MRSEEKLISDIIASSNQSFAKQVQEEVNASLRKLNWFLIEKGITESFRTIKTYPRLEIKGLGEDGGIKVLFPDLRKKFDIDTIEDSIALDSVFPPKQKGVIYNATETEGSYYKVYEVLRDDDDTFDLSIVEYRFYRNVFYPHYEVRANGLRKKMLPVVNADIQSVSVERALFSIYSKEELEKTFSEADFQNLKLAFLIRKDLEDAIIYETLGTFRVYNFLSELYSYDKHIIEDNDFFRLTHWNGFDNEVSSSLQVNYSEKIKDISEGYTVIDTHSLCGLLKSIIEENDIDNVYIAVGFAFLSGIKTLESSFEKIKTNNGNIQLTIGALQHYDNQNVNNRIDRRTICTLNRLLDEKKISLFTHSKSFYHGKFYYLGGKEKAFVIVGSSNISKSAFSDNIELDVLHVMKRGSSEETMFLDWYKALHRVCIEINNLDINSFTDFNWNSELDAFSNIKNRKASRKEVQEKIDSLTDKELKYRLNIWMEKNPTEFYEDLKIDALTGYTMFVYAFNQIVAFESFTPGNAYYVFQYNSSLSDLITGIAKMSKMEMSMSEHYVNRGYHIKNMKKVKQRIDRYFE